MTATTNASALERTPTWWFFDHQHGILFCETMQENGAREFHREITRILPSEKYDTAWVARTNDTDFILWKDKELVPTNRVVAVIEDWAAYGLINGEYSHEWTFTLYAALSKHVYWAKGEKGTEGFEVELEGYYDNHSSGACFRDKLRMIIPLQNGCGIGISERDRWYYLEDEPIDWMEFERESRKREKAAEKSRRKAERDCRKIAGTRQRPKKPVSFAAIIPFLSRKEG